MIKEAFELIGRVEAVLVANQTNSASSFPVKKIQVDRGYGVKGDRHAGSRLADVREKALLEFGFSKGMEIANHREFSAVSAEELVTIARLLDLPDEIPYGCLCENLVLSGIPKLSELPPGTMLFFSRHVDYPRTAVLIVWGENMPCNLPGEEIERHFSDIPKVASHFPKASIGQRGVVGSVYCSGFIHEGDIVIVKIPRQRIYHPL